MNASKSTCSFKINNFQPLCAPCITATIATASCGPTRKSTNGVSIVDSPNPAGTVSAVNPTEKGVDLVIDKTEGESVTQAIPTGPEVIVSVGEKVTLDQPVTNNPNVGGFGQTETEIILQSPNRVKGMIVFFFTVTVAQILLVLKKKQFEKVQAAEMNF